MDQDQIQQKMQGFLQNINANTKISDQKKQQLIQQLRDCEKEAAGNPDDFEESILCFNNDDMEIILHPPQNQQPQQGGSQIQPQPNYYNNNLDQSGGGFAPLNQSNEMNNMRRQQQYSNQGQMPIPPSQIQQQGPNQYPPTQQQGNKSQMGQGNYLQAGGQQIPKQPSSQSYNPPAELTPEQRRNYIYQFYMSIIKKRLQVIPKQDPKYQFYQQKFQLLYEKIQNQEEFEYQQWSFLESKQYVSQQLKLFDDNMRLCVDQQRRDSLQAKLNNLKHKLSKDPDLFYYYVNYTEFSLNDRKILMCEDPNCSQDLKLLIDYYKYTQNSQMLRTIEVIQQQKQIKGFDSFIKIIKENNIDSLFGCLDSRIPIFKRFYNSITLETSNYFKQLNIEQQVKIERQQGFEKYISYRIQQYLYREHLIFADQNDIQRIEPSLINAILKNKDFNQTIQFFQQLYSNSPEIISFNQKRDPPRQQYSSQNPQQQGLNSSTGPGGPSRQLEDNQNRQAQYQRQLTNPSANTQPPAEQIQLNNTLQPQSSNSQQGSLNKSQQLSQQSSVPSQIPQGLTQSQQFSSQQLGNIPLLRNQSEQSVKQEEDKRIIPPQQLSTQSQQSQGGSQTKLPTAQSYEDTPQGANPVAVKQEGPYQQPPPQQVKQMLPSAISPFQSKAKAKRLLGDESITKRLNRLCEENKVEFPQQQELQNILTYLNEVFKTYMKNLIERLLQSSIVENIDNEFRLFCAEKLEPHLVPFRGQPIDKYLLNKQDYQGVRDMTFLKYYIVQSENKNIRRSILERSDEEIELASYESILKNSLFDKSIMKCDLDRTQRKGCTASEEIKNNIQKMPPQKSKNAKKDLKQESMPQAISLATTNCQRQKITLKNLQLFLEADPIYRKSAILLKTYLQ